MSLEVSIEWLPSCFAMAMSVETTVVVVVAAVAAVAGPTVAVVVTAVAVPHQVVVVD